MKTYWDYEEKDRANFDDDRMTELLKLELMDKGLVMLEEPTLEVVPDEAAMPPKHTVYGAQANGRYSSDQMDVWFQTQEEAEKFVGTNGYKIAYDYNMGTRYEYEELIGAFSLTTKEVFLKADFDSIKEQVKVRDAARKRNNAATSDYTKAMNGIYKAEAALYDDWREVLSTKVRYVKLTDTYADYLVTCENSPTIAMQFLKKAYDSYEIKIAFDWLDVDLPSNFVEEDEKTQQKEEVTEDATKEDDTEIEY